MPFPMVLFHCAVNAGRLIENEILMEQHIEHRGDRIAVIERADCPAVQARTGSLQSSLLESSNRVYESTIGSVPGLAFSPVLVEWAMLGDVDHPAVVLFDLMEAELGEGAFVSGRVLDDDRGMLVFEPVGVMVELPGLEASVGEFLPLLGFGPGELTLRRAGLQQGTAMGEAGFVDGVWMLVMEWEYRSGLGLEHDQVIGILPIGAGLFDWEDNNEQAALPEAALLAPPIFIRLGTILFGGVQNPIKNLPSGNSGIEHFKPAIIPPHSPYRILIRRQCVAYDPSCVAGIHGSCGAEFHDCMTNPPLVFPSILDSCFNACNMNCQQYRHNGSQYLECVVLQAACHSGCITAGLFLGYASAFEFIGRLAFCGAQLSTCIEQTNIDHQCCTQWQEVWYTPNPSVPHS